MSASGRIFIAGRANPDEFGWPLRVCAGHPPSPDSIAEAARILKRASFFVDEDGYEREVIGAAVSPMSGAVAFVESRAKSVGSDKYGERQIDISIKVHIDDLAGNHREADIECYNPFFWL